MAKWIAKAVVQKCISFLPNKEKANHFFQTYITKGVQLTDEHFSNKLTHASDHIRFYNEFANAPLKNARVLELGSGWYPVVPVAMFLHGVRCTDSIDIQSWMTRETIIKTLEKFSKWEEEGMLHKYLPEIVPEQWVKIEEILESSQDMSRENLLEALNLQLKLKDARNTGFERHSYDFICSNNTFEHIYPEVLKDILKEFKKLINPGGFMSHFIDLSDHFAHFDKSITIYNFLKFSESSWRLIDNSIQPQNRLRWKEYLKMYNDLDIPVTKQETRPGSLSDLARVEVNKRFQYLSPEDLAISHGYILSVC